MLTLNQIVSQITTLATAHNQIAESGVGDFAEWQAKERNYPILWVFHESTSVNQMEIAFSIRLICADRVIVGEEGDNTQGHEQEVLSDTMLVLLDFLAYFQQNHNQPYNVVTSATIDPFTERLNDRLAGNSVIIQIRQPFDWNKCQVPQTGASIPPSVDGITLYNFCDPAVVARLTDEQRECLREALPTPCADADWSLTDTDGNELDSGSIPSGGSQVIVAPDATLKLNNSLITYPILSGELYNMLVRLNGQVPQTFSYTPSTKTLNVISPPCADATVELNGVEMATIPSGGTENIQVRQSSGSTLVGSQQGQYWRIGDSPISLNGTLVDNVKAEDSLNIPVIQDGSPAGSWNGTQWVIPACPQDLTIRIEVALAADTFTFTATANEAGNIATVNDGGLTSFVLSVNAAPVTAPFTIANGDVISAAFTAAGAATTVILTGTY